MSHGKQLLSQRVSLDLFCCLATSKDGPILNKFILGSNIKRIVAEQQSIEMEASSSNKYEKAKLIGCGSFGQAWLVRRSSDGRRYVQKEVRVGMLTGGERLQAFTEVEALARCRHPNVIRYREAFFRDADSVNQTLCIVMEFADSGKFY